jgi:hypothetical protein
MKIGQLAASKLQTVSKTVSGSKLFQNHTQWEKNCETESLKDFLLEIRFLFSYLHFKWLPFPNRLS